MGGRTEERALFMHLFIAQCASEECVNLCKEFDFTARMLKGSLAEGRKKVAK